MTLGRRTEQRGTAAEVAVLRHDREAVLPRVRPDGRVVRGRQTAVERERPRSRRREGGRTAASRGSGRGGASPSADRNQSPLAIRGEREAGPDVFARQVREVTEEVVLGHAGRQIVEHVGDRDAQATDAGLAAAFSRLDRDPVQVSHRSAYETSRDRSSDGRRARSSLAILVAGPSSQRFMSVGGTRVAHPNLSEASPFSSGAACGFAPNRSLIRAFSVRRRSSRPVVAGSAESTVDSRLASSSCRLLLGSGIGSAARFCAPRCAIDVCLATAANVPRCTQ